MICFQYVSNENRGLRVNCSALAIDPFVGPRYSLLPARKLGSQRMCTLPYAPICLHTPPLRIRA